MLKNKISTEKAPGAIGPYSQAIVNYDGMMFVSGQLPIDPATGEFPSDDIKELTKQALENVKAILGANGLGMENVVKTTVFLKDMADFAEMNKVYAEYFSEPYPARSAVQVAALPKGGRLEIEVIACL